MSFGAPRDVLLKRHSFEELNTQKPKFSIYKFNFPSGSLIQIKPPTSSLWSLELSVRVNTKRDLHILLRFMTNVEEKSYDGDFSNLFSENSISGSQSDRISHCSTISPETKKLKRLQSQWGWDDDNWSTVLCTPRTCALVRSNEKTKTKISLDRAQSNPVIDQISGTSSPSFSQAEHGISIREQLSHINQRCTSETEESSTQIDDSVYSMP